MFDFHMHSRLSFDSEENPVEMAKAAVRNGLSEICFTDHFDQHIYPDMPHNIFSLKDYADLYDNLEYPGLTIRRGVEFGLTHWNTEDAHRLMSERSFDFVLGSVHYSNGFDPFFKEFWEGRTIKDCLRGYFEETLTCVRNHDNFDVLGHLTYVCKYIPQWGYVTDNSPVDFDDYRELTDEILSILAKKGKGMEINTAGVDKIGDFMPSAHFLKRFKEMGGEIVTVGSDSHDRHRVGQHAPEALEILKDIFGYVCTFENRNPIFHKL